jgi:hypothetical protein
MKIHYSILISILVFGCASKNTNEKRVLDSLAVRDSIAKADSIAKIDSIAIADSIEHIHQVMAATWTLGDPEAQSSALKLEIINDSVVVHKVDFDALSFAFPGGHEYSSEDDDKILGFGDDNWLSGGIYTFEISHDECITDEINSRIDGLDSTYTKEINGLEFTIATGSVGGRDETNYYVCYRSHRDNCMSFSMEVRESGGGMDNYLNLVAQFENFIGSVKFK